MATTVTIQTPSRELGSSPLQGSINKMSDVFPSPPKTADVQLSPPPKKIHDLKRAASTPPEATNENYLRSSDKGLSGNLPSMTRLATAWDRQQLSKKRSQYYGEIFASKEPHHTAKDRVAQDSVIVANIRLNCNLEAEQTFLSDISFQLSEIYQRPESCVVVSLSSPQAMLFGGSFEPAYYMTITALASEIAPTKNKQSTALVQAFMHESLDITPRRGIVRFEPVPEENLATNGMTALQEIEEMQRASSEESRALRAISRNRNRKSKRIYTPAFLDRAKAPSPYVTGHEKLSSGENGGGKSSDVSDSEKKRLKRRKSILAFFGR